MRWALARRSSTVATKARRRGRRIQRALALGPTIFGALLLGLDPGHPVLIVSGLLLIASGSGALILSFERFEMPGCIWGAPLVPVALGAVVAAFFQTSAPLAVGQVLAPLLAASADLIAFVRPMGDGKP